MCQFLETRDHTHWDLTLEFLSTLHVEVTSALDVERGTFPFILIGSFMSLIWVPLIVYLIFHQVWTSGTVMSLRNSIQILFGMSFPGIIGMTLVISKATVLKTPIFVWPNGY